jgi:hypothetical protein
MQNIKLIQLLESVLGKGKPTSSGNIAFFSPFASHYKPKLEIRSVPDAEGNYTWHCWISDKKGKSVYSLFKQLNLPKEHILSVYLKLVEADKVSRIFIRTKYSNARNITIT